MEKCEILARVILTECAPNVWPAGVRTWSSVSCTVSPVELIVYSPLFACRELSIVPEGPLSNNDLRIEATKCVSCGGRGFPIGGAVHTQERLCSGSEVHRNICVDTISISHGFS